MYFFTFAMHICFLLHWFFVFFFFFFNDTATTEIYTLSLHDALPILEGNVQPAEGVWEDWLLKLPEEARTERATPEDRKSTRLNSSHANISYAVFCLKKKKPDSPRWQHLVVIEE